MINYRECDALGSTDIKNLLKLPEFFIKEKLRTMQGGDNSTPPMERGTRIHTALLEPEEFEKRYIVHDFRSKLLKDYKLFKEDCDAKNVVPISREEYNEVEALKKIYVPILKEVRKKYDDGCKILIEEPLYADVTIGNALVPLKAKPDLLLFYEEEQSAVIVDIKTIGRDDIYSLKSMRNYFFKYSVGLQLLHYGQVLRRAKNVIDVKYRIIWVGSEIIKHSPIPCVKVEANYDIWEEALINYVEFYGKDFLSESEVTLFSEGRAETTLFESVSF